MSAQSKVKEGTSSAKPPGADAGGTSLKFPVLITPTDTIQLLLHHSHATLLG